VNGKAINVKEKRKGNKRMKEDLKGGKNMLKNKKLLVIALCMVMLSFTLTGCQSEADKVSYNLSLEADNFNVVRQLTVIDCITGDVLFQMTGRISIKADKGDINLK
jgi:hypothetical protein